MISKRQQITARFLIGSTVLYYLLFFLLKDIKNAEGLLLFSPPILFGLGLYYSNKNFFKLKTPILLPSIFFVIFLLGTIPFYSLINILNEIIHFEFEYDSSLLDLILGCMSSLFFVFFATWLNIKGIKFGKLQILLILLLSIIVGAAIKFIGSELTILFYQLAMTIVIVSSISEKKLHLSLELSEAVPKD